MNEIQVEFCSINDLFDKNMWSCFLSEVEVLLGEKLSHLDINDPVRKKVTNVECAVDFICALGDQEDSRWLFGKFGHRKVSMSLFLLKDASNFPNSVSIYFPMKWLEDKDSINSILSVFKLGNEYLKPFYSYADKISQVAAKRKLNRMAVDLEAELVGMFWLTYLNQKYTEFFGKSKLEQLASLNADVSVNDLGVTCRFGKLPASAESIALRMEAEKILGAESFVDPKLSFDKPKGQHALTYDQLRS